MTSPDPKDDSRAVEGTILRFLDAFRNLEWEGFIHSFASDATAFLPYRAGRWFPNRVNGKAEIEAAFRPFFHRLRSELAESPYLEITPEDLHIQMLPGSAVITFHLEGDGFLDRRTFVLQKQGDEWLIVHLHASHTTGKRVDVHLGGAW
jgi:ketosteroid isomerase-like protein